MNKIITIIVLSFCFFSSSAQNIPKWKVIDFKQYADTAKVDLLIINLWATFCKPCVEEIPDLINVSAKYGEKIRLIFVSVDADKDYPKKLKRFIKKRHLKMNTTWLNETNADYFCPAFDSSWSGSIPATLFISKKTNSRLFIESEMSADEFEQHIQSFLLEKK